MDSAFWHGQASRDKPIGRGGVLGQDRSQRGARPRGGRGASERGMAGDTRVRLRGGARAAGCGGARGRMPRERSHGRLGASSRRAPSRGAHPAGASHGIRVAQQHGRRYERGIREPKPHPRARLGCALDVPPEDSPGEPNARDKRLDAIAPPLSKAVWRKYVRDATLARSAYHAAPKRNGRVNAKPSSGAPTGTTGKEHEGANFRT